MQAKHSIPRYYFCSRGTCPSLFIGYYARMKDKKPKQKIPQNGLKALALMALIGAIFMGISQGGTLGNITNATVQEVSISELQQLYRDGQLKSLEIKDNSLTASDGEKTKYETTKEPNANIADLGFNDPTIATNVKIIDTSGTKTLINVLMSIVPFLLLVGIILFMSRRAMGQMGGGGEGPFSFGRTKARLFDASKKRTKFTDVAGATEAKEEVQEVVDFLKNPDKYAKMGAKIPKGILMIGSPGTGKTLMARAIAGEANVPFYSVSGSEFVEMFVGVGASRVRDLFKQAKKSAPSIIFIDEIDAIGKQRGQGTGGGHDEREQTLNQILTEMDGFEPGQTVIVIAATNRPDVLDKALLRPGRFDRRVHIDLPDMSARAEILTLHGKNKQLGDDINMKEIASKTVGFAGAELENVLNEAAIMAVKQRAKKISQEDLNQAVEKVAMGAEKKSRKISDKERKIVAYHEVGHAIAGHFTETGDPVHKITVIPRGGALGVTWFLPEEDTYLKSSQRLKDEMVSLHGGRVAENLIFGEMTTGASNDLERITAIAKGMVMTYGMGGDELGPVVFKKAQKDYGVIHVDQNEFSQDTARLIDEQVRSLINEAETRCREILERHLPLLHKISLDLLEKENMYREEFLAYFDPSEQLVYL